MPEFDLFTGRPIRSTSDEPRFWSDHPARDWHIEAARKADTIARLAHEIATEQDPLKRHSLQVRLASLTGGAIPVYQEPAQTPPAEPAPAPTHDPEADRAAQRYLTKTRRGRRK